MRPVEKGPAPRTYSRYQDAGQDLQSRLGHFCSYCERQIETHLAVEHVQPKSRQTNVRNRWTNFLLACVHCNSSKGKKRVALRDYFWPDRDNTLRAITYARGGTLAPAAGLGAAAKNRANDTLALTGLDKEPGKAGREPTRSDRRWLRRVEAWQLAEVCRSRLQNNNTQEVRELIVENAVARGMFSVWWTAFAGDVDMRGRLRQAFVGTHHASFDVNEDLVPRTEGQL